MKISVVIPAYNCAHLIGATLDSLLAQTFSEFEVIIVNDGSTDGTLGVLNAYAAKDSRIHILSVKNGGPARARNLAIEQAQGEYLSFLDADDLVEPDLFERMYSLAAEHDLDEVACGYRMEHEGKHPNPKDFSFEPFVAENAAAFRQKLTPLIQAHLMYVVWNKLFRTSMIRENAIRFPDYLSGEDRLFNTFTFPHIQRFGFVEKPLYRYFLRGQQSLANRYVKNRFEAALTCHTELLAAYEAMDLLSDENRTAIDFMFVKGIMSCFTQLSSKACPLSFREKKALIGEILQNEYVHEAIQRDDSSFGYSKLVNGVLRSNRSTWIYLMAKAIFLMQFKLNGLYLKLKHNVKSTSSED